MRLAKLLSGEPVSMDVPVYDAASLVAGELVMRGAHGGATNSYYITAYTGGAGEAVNALGICQETIVPTGTAATGHSYAKCIVNPNAIYLAEYLQTSGNVIDVTTGSASTTLTIAALEDNIDGGWVYFTEKVASGAPGAGSLRYLSASAAGSATMDSAVTITTSSDCIKILPVGHQLTSLDAGATGLLSSAAAGSGVSIMIVENYVQRGHIMEALRYSKHAGLNSLDKDTTKFYAAIKLLDHAFDVSS